MTENLPARQDHGELVVDTVHDMHADHHDPQHQEGRQNVSVALLPLALITLLLLTFVAAAWTFLAAQPPV
jgi:Flp pilus assembly protein TadB